VPWLLGLAVAWEARRVEEMEMEMEMAS